MQLQVWLCTFWINVVTKYCGTRNGYPRKLRSRYLTSTRNSFHCNQNKFSQPTSNAQKKKIIYLSCLLWKLTHIKHFLLFHFIQSNTDKKELLFHTALNTNQILEINNSKQHHRNILFNIKLPGQYSFMHRFQPLTNLKWIFPPF